MQIYTTELPKEMVKVFIFVIIFAIVNSIVTLIVGRIKRYDEGINNAFINSVMFYNSGNIGIPLITLIFSTGPFLIGDKTPYLSLALSAQIIVLIVQNISTNTIGFYNAGKGKMKWQDSIKGILEMPSIYMILLAFTLRQLPFRMENLPIWAGLVYLKDGMISFALITLGVQLSKTKISAINNDIFLSNLIRLVGGPFFALVILKMFGISGVIAQTLMISSGLPTAINTALIAVERNNHSNFASLTVMTSTLLSSITLVFVVLISRFMFPV